MDQTNERPLRGDSVELNRRYLDSLLVEGRIVGAEHPDTRVTLFGREFSTPGSTGALRHLKCGMAAFAEGARLADAPCFVGMGGTEELKNVLAMGAGVIRIIKPYADPNEILGRIACCEENGIECRGADMYVTRHEAVRDEA